MKRLTVIAAIFACILPSLAQPPAPKRPLGVPADAVHFNGKWYHVYLERTTWRRAKEKCAVLGGQLASVPNKPAQAFIRELSKGVELWLGATDEKVEGLWVWLDGTEMKYKNWGKGQPRGSRTENYLALGWQGQAWFDAPDNWGCSGFICEWKGK
jgi:hypothetical protein